MKAGKNHRYMETKHILLKNCFINKKIKGKKYLKINKIMKTTYQNASYTSKGYEEGSLQNYRKQKNQTIQMNNLTLHLKDLDK